MLIKIKQVLLDSFKLSVLTVILPVLFFIINNIILLGKLDFLGIHSRDFTLLNLIGIPFSWVIHGNFNHLCSNIVAVILLTPVFVSVCDKTKITIFFLILTSGIATWILGASNTVHIGESGLIYSIVGYILYYIYFNRDSILIFTTTVILSIIASSYLIGILEGLMPKDGISLAAHLGGLISGVFVSKFINSRKFK